MVSTNVYHQLMLKMSLNIHLHGRFHCFHLISDHIDEIFIPYLPDSLCSVIRGDNIQLITYIPINDVGVYVCIYVCVCVCVCVCVRTKF